jgi:hypothetical protein
MSGGAPAYAPREALALIHHHPGRLRVRADAFRRRDGADPDAVVRARTALDALPGVAQVVHNGRTGSLLIEYEPGLAQPEAILRRITDAAGLDMPPDGPRPQGREPAIVAIDSARELNELFAEVTGYRADLRGLLPAGMAALAVYSFAFGKDARLPRWDNLLYWSYNIFSQLHRREIEGSSDTTDRGEP